MITGLSEYLQLLQRVSQATKAMPRRAATLAVNFSKDRFVQQNWVDNGTEPWKKRKKSSWGKRERPGRAILVDKGRLRRSIHIISVDDNGAVIGTDVPYAHVHNFGFKGSITQRVKAHQRRKFSKQKVGTGTFNMRTRQENTRSRTVVSSTANVRAFTRTIKVDIPKRQFIGESAILSNQIQRMMTAEFMRAIRG